VVYRGYENKGKSAKKRTDVIDAIVETVKRCPSPGTRNEGWLLVGLVGKWPKTTRLYYHTLRVGDAAAQPRGW
jgi:hypothetical protein